jgi:hypothetical protein
MTDYPRVEKICVVGDHNKRSVRQFAAVYFGKSAEFFPNNKRGGFSVYFPKNYAPKFLKTALHITA